jgi:nucleoside-diphosphate-sugar epimerase
MKTIAVTGGSGKLGTQVVKELRQQFQVVSLDHRLSDQLHVKQIQVDLNDFGQVVGALHGADAVIHLAAIPAPLGFTNSYIFANNSVAGYHILEAASILGIRKVVMGSSESSYGFAWAPRRFSPNYLPLDEDHPQQPQECYGLSKIVNEITAAMFHRMNGMEVVSLRFSTIVSPEEYPRMDTKNPERHKHTLWSYIDIRDAVSACLASLETEEQGAVCLNVTSNDTLSDWETERLLDRFYPDVTDRRLTFRGREAIVSNQRAKDVLRWSPQYSWTNQ